MQQLNLPFQFNYVLCFKPNCIQMEKGNMAFVSHICVFFFNHLFIIYQSGIYSISTEQNCTLDNCLLPHNTFWSINRRIVIQVSLSVKTLSWTFDVFFYFYASILNVFQILTAAVVYKLHRKISTTVKKHFLKTNTLSQKGLIALKFREIRIFHQFRGNRK